MIRSKVASIETFLKEKFPFPEGNTKLTKAVRNSILGVLFLLMMPGSCIVPASCASYLATQFEEKKEEVVKVKSKIKEVLQKDENKSALALENK